MKTYIEIFERIFKFCTKAFWPMVLLAIVYGFLATPPSPAAPPQKHIQTKYESLSADVDEAQMKVLALRAKRWMFSTSMTSLELFALDLKIFAAQQQYDSLKDQYEKR